MVISINPAITAVHTLPQSKNGNKRGTSGVPAAAGNKFCHSTPLQKGAGCGLYFQPPLLPRLQQSPLNLRLQRFAVRQIQLVFLHKELAVFLAFEFGHRPLLGNGLLLVKAARQLIVELEQFHILGPAQFVRRRRTNWEIQKNSRMRLMLLRLNPLPWRSVRSRAGSSSRAFP
jgi:hypothetical protein